MSMETDVIGRVRNTRLGARSGLMPLFEAVVNSIHSIQDAAKHDGRITIRIERDKQLSIDSQSGGANPIETFVIADNGTGFTEENYKSFATMDSQRKFSRGGKGVGRLLWLKAFDEVEIESTYSEGNSWFKRRFSFKPTLAGIEGHSKEPLKEEKPPAEPSTTVRLKRFKDTYQKPTVKAADAIAHRIVEHCLEYYLLGGAPQIVVSDPVNKETIDLNHIYASEVRSDSPKRTITIGTDTLSIHDVFVRGTSDPQHRLHLCAHNRAVESMSLAGKISHLDSSFRNEATGEATYYHCYITGSLLDNSVDAARTGFVLDRDDELAYKGESTYEDVIKESLRAVREFLEPRTAEAKRKAFERIQSFVEHSEPRYRPLLNHRKTDVEEISGTVTAEKLDDALHSIYHDWRRDVTREAAQKLSETPATPDAFALFKEDFAKIIGDLQEVAKSELSDYVVHRATVLSFFEKILGTTEAGVFETEDSLHNFLFPQRKTSNEVDLDEHNLWVIDERLVYHRYFASDLPFKQQKASPVQVDSDDRADFLIYNSPIAFSVGEDSPINSVVIVELKRPHRTGYKDSENPIRQTLSYVDLIREGKARRKDGSYIDKMPDTTPFFCYIIADLTDNLRKEIRNQDFIETPDRLGYFKHHKAANAYIEISGYRKVLLDARSEITPFSRNSKLN